MDITVFERGQLLQDTLIVWFDREVAVRRIKMERTVFIHKACGSSLIPIIAQPIPIYDPDRINTQTGGEGAKSQQTSLLRFYQHSLNYFTYTKFPPTHKEGKFTMKKSQNGVPQKNQPEKLDADPNAPLSRWLEFLFSIWSKMIDSRPPPEVTTLRLLIVSVVFVLIILILVVAGQADYLRDVLPNLPFSG